MTHSSLSRLVLAALVAAGTPVGAAVTPGAPAHIGSRPAETAAPYERRQGSAQTERTTETYDVGDNGSLDLQNVSGDVRVTAGRGGTIRVEAVKQVRRRDDEAARQLLQDLRIETSHVGNRVEIRTVYPRTNGRISASVDFTVTVPAGTAVALKTVSGDITVTGVEGEVRVEAISGDVEVSGTPDVAVAKTVSGDVSARNIGSESGLSLGSVSGNIIATALKVRTLEAGTVSGDLVLSDLQVERLEAKSVSGNIQCTVALQRGGRYTFNSHSGDVRLAVGGDAGFELDASTFSGSIRSDFPITLRGEQERGRRVPRTIRGSFGDAGAILSIRSFSGTVVIEKG